MAAPITHIVLTEKIFNTYFKDKNKKKFYIGTLFPDIRYITKIKRTKTHIHLDDLDDIKALESFRAGLIFHNYLDELCEKYIQSEDIYQLIKKENPAVNTAIKIAEDVLLYDKIDNWDVYIDYLDKILLDEINFNISEATIKLWHQWMKGWLSSKPVSGNHEKLLYDIHSKEEIAEMLEIVEILKKNQRFIQIVNKLYNDIGLILEKP